MSEAPDDIPVGIHPAVWEWLPKRSSCGSAWPLQKVLRAKRSTRISVVLPARDEEQTVGNIVAQIHHRLVDNVGLVDEIIVVDSRSSDNTAGVAAAAGATVVHQDQVLPDQPRMDGKGDALWKGLAASTGDVVVFIDSDLRDFSAQFVVGLLGPLLCQPEVLFVKAHYRRPLVTQHATIPGGGGRVSELVARPLINMFWPQLAGFIQPLAGEYGGYRRVMEQISFTTGYGVELGMLIDLLNLVGLDALAQVDLGTRTHRHHDIEALGRMAAQILHTAASRLRSEQRGVGDATASTWLTQFRYDATTSIHHQVVSSDIAVQDRPPLTSVGYDRTRRDTVTAAGAPRGQRW